jgi:hypothetical protein
MTQNLLGVKQAHEKYKFRKRVPPRDIGMHGMIVMGMLKWNSLKQYTLLLQQVCLEFPKISSVRFFPISAKRKQLDLKLCNMF